MKKTTMLKKAMAVACAALMMVPSFAVASSARNTILVNDETDVPYAEPVIDGKLSKDDGWSDPVYLDQAHTYNFVPSAANTKMTAELEISFACGKDGLYFAAEIDESKGGDGAFCLSDGLDEPDENGHRPYGFNGDVLAFSFDPYDKYLENGYRTGGDCAPFYCVGMFDDGAKMYHSQVTEGILTEEDGVKLAGKYTDKGWTFEAMIPWNVILADMEENSYGRVTSTVDDLRAQCARYSATCIYRDMFYDIEQRSNQIYGIFPTVLDYTKDGQDVTGTSDGVSVRFFGLGLYMGGRVDFEDVSIGQWFYKGVGYCYRKSLLRGISDTQFGPDMKMTRAMIVTALGANSKVSPRFYSGTNFTDVKEDDWFAPYVEWARKNGIVAGYTDGTFNPNGEITREELALILNKYADHIALRTKEAEESVLDNFADKDSVSSWALPAVKWAVKNKIIGGTDKGIEPKGNATRAQVAVMLYQLLRTGYVEFL